MKKKVKVKKGKMGTNAQTNTIVKLLQCLLQSSLGLWIVVLKRNEYVDILCWHIFVIKEGIIN